MTIAGDHPDLLRAARRRVLITVDQYDRMVQTGILPGGSPIELLDGMLVAKDRSARGEDPISVGTGHRWAGQAINRHLTAVRQMGCDLQTQQPVVLPPFGEPEPDGAIIVEAADQYRDRKPGPADIHCVIEVADSSLEHDRTTKYRIYATAGIPQYVIVNLIDRVIETYTRPTRETGRYEKAETFSLQETVQFFYGHESFLPVPAASLIP